MSRWRWGLRRERPGTDRQLAFGFLDRSRKRQRTFRIAVVLATAAAVAGILAASPVGRLGVVIAVHRARWAVRWTVGLRPTREEIEAETNLKREVGIDRTRAALADEIRLRGPILRRLFESTGMAPDSGVIRWGNYNGTLVLSSDVFEPDDNGRSYRLRPNTQSIWAIGLSLRGALCQFQVPDTPEARSACSEAGGRLVPESVQTTNSWGCRGPEPDLSASLRGIVLGDSVMQGLLVSDDQTPSICLERELARRTGLRTSVLNTGVLGYSTEQYYFTFLQFLDRMKPNFVIVSLCGNDFYYETSDGWDEPCYWLDRILQTCRQRELACLVVPWPGEDALLATRDDSVYPGQVSHRLKLAGTHYFYPVEAFATEDMRVRLEWETQSKGGNPSPLYNRRLAGDNHLSALGCAFWGRCVAERLHLILQRGGVLPTSRPTSKASSPIATGP